MGIQRNMFSDVALQDIGHVILGTAFARNPELNSDGNFVAEDFTPETHNSCWQDYTIMTKLVWSGSIGRVMSEIDGAINNVAEKLVAVMEGAKGQLVAGTMRIHMTMAVDGKLNGTLLWVQKRG